MRIKTANTIEYLHEIAASGIKYRTIYTDPPWQYRNRASRGAAENHYRTMALDDIINLPVEGIAEKDAHLHLWTTNAFLFEARKVIEAWGFEYKSMLIWTKPQMGLGNFWRVSHEILLLGVRGKCPFLDRSIKSWIEVSRGKHSQKPEEIRALIERVSPPPRIELFARRQVPGWTVWGDEIKGGWASASCPTRAALDWEFDDRDDGSTEGIIEHRRPGIDLYLSMPRSLGGENTLPPVRKVDWEARGEIWDLS